jgi:hypothetical protein
MRRRELIALALVAACNSGGGAALPAPKEPDPSPEPPEPPAFEVKVTPPASCAHATPCEATIALTALRDYKVNKDYPFKFVGDTAPGYAFDGTGTFARTDNKTGTMTIRFTVEKAGTAKVSGTFKLSVCTEEVCKIESPKIASDVPVT